jgi:small-conductance mechanosensitive channel
MNRDFTKLFDPLHGALWSPRLLIPLGVAAGMSFLLFIVRGIVLRLLNKNRQGENSELSLFSIFRTPSLYWCVALGLYAGIALSELDSKYAHDLNQFVHVVMVLSLTLAAANVSAGVFKNIMVVADHGAQTSGLAVGVVKGAVHATGILIVLSMLGISIAPLLTALGVGGLAVALALKDTLENLFAGIYLITDKAIRVGDFVRLESGQEGNIEDIGWRTIRIRTLNNNIVILPNSKLAQSIVTNFSLPDRRISVSIPVTVSLDADLDKVEALLLDTANKASEDVVGLVGSPSPSVRFNPGAGENSMVFTVGVQVAEFPDQFFVQHELRKRIFKRLRAEKIPMPRTVIGLVDVPPPRPA